jgi:hypothetical protein
MSRPSRLRLALVSLPILAAVLAWPRLAPPATAHGLEGRVAEPLVIEGADLTPFHGAAWDALWVYAWDHGEWAFVLGQMDERDAQDQFVASEDGRLDANDVYVFMADVLGQARPTDAWPAGIGRQHPAIEVKVVDPLHPEAPGYAYVFWSDERPYPRPAARVRWDEAKRELSSDYYTLGFPDPAATADGFVGVKRLSIFGGARDLLDRLKIRATTVIGPIRSQLDEVQLAPYGQQFAVAPVKLGPLRAILDPTGTSTAYAQRVTLFGGLDQLGDVGGTIPGLEVRDLRVSLDLAPELGEVAYRDANTPAGVAVDGNPDVVSSSPLPAWRELAFEEGRAVLLRVDPAQASTATVYYKDDGGTDPEDTGDQRSFGDQGIAAADVEGFLGAGFPGQMVVLPNGGPVTPELLAAAKAAPLEVTVTVGPLPPTSTPGGETPTPTRSTPSPADVLLPWAGKTP